jgi:two-component system cell cycle sensor histidine kinase/response regulator CckA
LVEANEKLKREIEERKRAEMALQGNKREWEKTFNAISDWVCLVDLDSRILKTNVAGEKFVSVPMDQIFGQTCCKLLHGSDKPIAGCPTQRMLETHQRETVEFQTPEGLWLTVTADPVTDKEGQLAGAVHITRDITDRKQAEEALRRSENLFRTLINATKEAIISIGQDGLITIFNPAAEKMFGRKREEMIDRPLDLLMPEEYRDRHQQYVKTYFATGKPNKAVGRLLELPGLRGNGDVFPTEISLSAGRCGDKQFVIAVARDVTERKQRQEQRKKLEARLQQTQKMEAIETLAGGIAHYFNNLLMGIQGHASLMMLYTDSEHPHFERLKGIEDMVQRGEDLTRQLLGFARGGKYQVRLSDLNDLIEKSSEMFGRTKKEIRIHRRCQKDIWPVEVDPGQIEHVLINIYVNAWYAMPRGGHLYVETSNVVLDEDDTDRFSVDSGNYVKISVTDTGVGMDEATRQRIFEPFFTTKEMGRGAGLGLASAYGIIKNHGGIINVHGEKGEGTTFDIYLPVSEKEVKTDEGKLADEILKGTEIVLLVDDEDVVLDVGNSILKEAGYRVLLARSGREALEVYGKDKDEIDLVILDMIMPDMSGGEVYDRMKEMNPKIKALLSSGYSIDGQASEILERGCDGFIQKPFNIKELSRKLTEILGKK